MHCACVCDIFLQTQVKRLLPLCLAYISVQTLIHLQNANINPPPDPAVLHCLSDLPLSAYKHNMLYGKILHSESMQQRAANEQAILAFFSLQVLLT